MIINNDKDNYSSLRSSRGSSWQLCWNDDDEQFIYYYYTFRVMITDIFFHSLIIEEETDVISSPSELLAT